MSGDDNGSGELPLNVPPEWLAGALHGAVEDLTAHARLQADAMRAHSEAIEAAFGDVELLTDAVNGVTERVQKNLEQLAIQTGGRMVQALGQAYSQAIEQQLADSISKFAACAARAEAAVGAVQHSEAKLNRRYRPLTIAFCFVLAMFLGLSGLHWRQLDQTEYWIEQTRQAEAELKQLQASKPRPTSPTTRRTP